MFHIRIEPTHSIVVRQKSDPGKKIVTEDDDDIVSSPGMLIESYADASWTDSKTKGKHDLIDTI